MEDRIVPPLLAAGAQYEPIRLSYPAVQRGYMPDVVLPNGIVLEIKGWFQPKDRSKTLAVLAAHPGLDLRIVLASPQQRLSAQSKTTQALWCEQHGIKWADNAVPAAWLSEPPNEQSLAIIAAAPKVVKKSKKRA